jgi:hypothetical protein
MKLEKNPIRNSNTAKIRITRMITRRIQIANFKRYHPIIAAAIITIASIKKESMKAKIPI